MEVGPDSQCAARVAHASDALYRALLPPWCAQPFCIACVASNHTRTHARALPRPFSIPPSLLATPPQHSSAAPGGSLSSPPPFGGPSSRLPRVLLYGALSEEWAGAWYPLRTAAGQLVHAAAQARVQAPVSPHLGVSASPCATVWARRSVCF